LFPEFFGHRREKFIIVKSKEKKNINQKHQSFQELEKEIDAYCSVYDILKVLDNAQIKSILYRLSDEFELDKYPDLKADERDYNLEYGS
jgi:hypothetical protein